MTMLHLLINWTDVAENTIFATRSVEQKKSAKARNKHPVSESVTGHWRAVPENRMAWEVLRAR